MTGFAKFAKENADGWSLVAVRAPIDDLAGVLRGEDQVLEYQPHVPVEVMTRDSEGLGRDAGGNLVTLTPVRGRRTSFVVQLRGSTWAVLLRTICWADTEDIAWVSKAAPSLSGRLCTQVVASCANDHGLACQVYESGTLSQKVNGSQRKKVVHVFDTRGIEVPLCFIGGNPAKLFALKGALEQIERADRVEFRVPTVDPLRDYRDLEAWRVADELAGECLNVTRTFPREVLSELTMPIRQDSAKIHLNIAAGHRSNNKKKYLQNLKVSEEALTQLVAHLKLCGQRGVLGAEPLQHLLGLADRTGQLLATLRSSLG